MSFKDVQFTGNVYFDHLTAGQVQFVNVQFADYASFCDMQVGEESYFGVCEFRGMALFVRTQFSGEASFIHTRFCRAALFQKTTFDSGASFEKASFRQGPGFAGASVGNQSEFVIPLPRGVWFLGNARPFKRREEGETAYRLAKQAAINRGDYEAAGDYHYAERCAVETGQRKRSEWRIWKKRFWEDDRNYVECLMELIFARCLFGYGEKPARMFFTAIFVILICAVFYCTGGGIAMNSEAVATTAQPVVAAGWWESLYFSIVTFTTLGYGVFRPMASVDWRLLAGSEALAGAALMAMFIVSLTRKYMR